MADKSSIEWTDATWNPVRGCSIVSKGCTNCYAMRQAHRHNHPGGAYEGLTMMSKGGPVWNGATLQLGGEHLRQPLRWRRPRRIFVNSMSDLFHESLDFEYIDEVWRTMAEASHHVFQILTKRPKRMRDYLVDRLTVGGIVGTPLPNVWLGVSVEDQAAADERIPLLLETPAAVRWISAEPLLGPVEIFSTITGDLLHEGDGSIDWIVAGGESGPGARPMHPDWARSLRDQCAVAHDGVPFFFKQWGNWQPINYRDQNTGNSLLKLVFTRRETTIGGPAEGTTPCNVRNVGKRAAGRLLDGRTHDEYPG